MTHLSTIKNPIKPRYFGTNDCISIFRSSTRSLLAMKATVCMSFCSYRVWLLPGIVN